MYCSNLVPSAAETNDPIARRHAAPAGECATGEELISDYKMPRSRKYGTVVGFRMTEKVKEMTGWHMKNCRPVVD
jgi:hypothetical protein